MLKNVVLPRLVPENIDIQYGLSVRKRTHISNTALLTL